MTIINAKEATHKDASELVYTSGDYKVEVCDIAQTQDEYERIYFLDLDGKNIAQHKCFAEIKALADTMSALAA